MASPQMEDYLAAIGRLEERGERVTTSALAKEHGVSCPSVTEALRRLAERGLIAYEPRGVVSLTAEGRNLTSSVVRRHRLWERFLHDVLGLKWDKVHDEACRLEHATSLVVERRLAEVLNESETCPHGYAIPGAAGDTRKAPVLPLSKLEPGQSARIASVEEDGQLLRRLEKLGIKPGLVVRREDVPHQNGTLALLVDGQRQSLEGDAAARIKVLVLSPEEIVGKAEGTIALSDLVPDEVGVVKELGTGRTFVSRCLALGFTPGVLVKMVQNFGRGPVIVLVRDTRVALGRGQAQKIHVVKKGDAHASAG